MRVLLLPTDGWFRGLNSKKILCHDLQIAKESIFLDLQFGYLALEKNSFTDLVIPCIHLILHVKRSNGTVVGSKYSRLKKKTNLCIKMCFFFFLNVGYLFFILNSRAIYNECVNRSGSDITKMYIRQRLILRFERILSDVLRGTQRDVSCEIYRSNARRNCFRFWEKRTMYWFYYDVCFF